MCAYLAHVKCAPRILVLVRGPLMRRLFAQSGSQLWTFGTTSGPDGVDVGRVVDLVLRKDSVFALCDKSGSGGPAGDAEERTFTVVHIDVKVRACSHAHCALAVGANYAFFPPRRAKILPQ